MLSEFAGAGEAEGLAPLAEPPRRRAVPWAADLGYRVGDEVRGRDGSVVGRVSRVTRAEIAVRGNDGEERTFSRALVERTRERLVERARIDEDAARQGFERDEAGEWVRPQDGMVMRAQRIPGGLGEVGWYRFDPDTLEQVGEEPDRKCEVGPELREAPPYLACPHFPLRCTASQHLGTRAGDGWVVACPNNPGRAPGWDNERLARESVRPDASPDVSLHTGDQTARPGTRTTGWSAPSGGTGRGS
jgi:hypothetical protein